ncbi:MAG: RNA polymerase-associated protein RapA [Desulfobacterales bacterium]|nr:RNA polymerase-associated protein RapA [Desulfobacterales bacterium]
MEKFINGQRWISEMEPELGLGTITDTEYRSVHVRFYGSGCERRYAITSAPLKRVRFKAGDVISSRDNIKISVEKFIEAEGLISYYGDGHEIHEQDLSDTISFSTPGDRLTNGLVDSNSLFNLRCDTLTFQAKIRESAVRGFSGGRVDLIPHQFYLAGEIASRHIPRVLLSDEVGLGKTIEACLVLHRLLICERISRILIIVPNSLVHQWFVELYRRFNLVFRIFDEELCLSAEQQEPGINPFMDYQLGICSIDFLNNDKRKAQTIEVGWDMLIVDEAHHIIEESPEYLFLEDLGQNTRGLMLLTATPDQLGERSHFAHLRLLDPARYYDFEDFQKSAEDYHKTAEIIDRIINKRINGEEVESSAIRLGYKSNENIVRFKDLINGGVDDQKQLIDEILDRHGAGRIIFRNTRAAIKGFPKRFVKLYPLNGSDKDIHQANLELNAEINGKNEKTCNYTDDPRISFLVDLLKRHKKEKVLLICRSLKRSAAIETAIKKLINIKIALFNEKMTLIQRDRSAAWFSEKNGAQIMICSEIGSEGRNFQFAHHLVLFDLPLNPELLEQRIGRLDRIGQTSDIIIHVPYIRNSAWEILITWHQAGLDIFEHNVNGAHHIFKKFGPDVIKLIRKQINETELPKSALSNLIKKTVNFRIELAKKLESGRDRLLELNSFRPEKAKQLTDEIERNDETRDLDNLMLRIFEQYGIMTDPMGKRTWRLKFSDLVSPEFPVPTIRKNGMVVTFDRKTALSREEIDFISRDNPMVTGSMELLLGTEKGNSTLAIWHDADKPGILLETFFVPECIALPELQIDRFLSASPVRIVVNNAGEDVSTEYPFELFEKNLEDLSGSWLSENPEIPNKLLPEMFNKAGNIAEKILPRIIKSGVLKMESVMETEIRRLKELRKVNPEIREEEIDFMAFEMGAIRKYMETTRFRLDAARAIYML